MSRQQEENRHVVVCGGGLVGSLMTCFLAKRGFSVDIFEKRPDVRLQGNKRGRSINLTLAERGAEALKRVGLDELVVSYAIPLHGRMIHDQSGHCRPNFYGKTVKESILSLNRSILNDVLLGAAEKLDRVKTYFDHKFVSCCFETGEIVFSHEGQEVKRKADLILGCDGAFSSIRMQIMKNPDRRFSFHQEYISHGYMEFVIQATPDNEYALEKNYLHLWPHKELVLLAMPNLDKTFTVTLIMTYAKYDEIKTEENVMKFFHEYFPDSIPLLTEEYLRETFLSSKLYPLMNVKCFPYHLEDKTLLLGDSAHAMVPFYGQGMNCGFEDCLVLGEMLDKHNNDLSKALPEYTKLRKPDVDSMCDLALYNYTELRTVNNLSYIIRRHLDAALNRLFPSGWIPLYNSVSFTRMRYHECIKHRAWQDKVLSKVRWGLSSVAAACVAMVTWSLLA